MWAYIGFLIFVFAFNDTSNDDQERMLILWLFGYIGTLGMDAIESLPFLFHLTYCIVMQLYGYNHGLVALPSIWSLVYVIYVIGMCTYHGCVRMPEEEEEDEEMGVTAVTPLIQ